MATRDQITRAILSIRYMPNSSITQTNVAEIVSMFEIVLEDLSANTLDAAIRQCLSTETFFPTPGRIREIAMELQMIAMCVPLPAVAWGMVLTAQKHIPSVWCEIGAILREDALDGRNSNKYYRHIDGCMFCKTGGWREVYEHAVVEDTVKALGGREAIITDNPMADRARFTDAYREIISRERAKLSMTQMVKQYVEAQAIASGNTMLQLSKGMTK